MEIYENEQKLYTIMDAHYKSRNVIAITYPILYPIPRTLYPVPHTMYVVPRTMYLVPHTWYPVPNQDHVHCTLHAVPCTLDLVPSTPYPIPCTPCVVLPHLANRLKRCEFRGQRSAEPWQEIVWEVAGRFRSGRWRRLNPLKPNSKYLNPTP